MEQGDWTDAQVQRATKNSLIWNGISLTVLAIVVWLLSDYYYWFLRGPAQVTDAQLLTLIQQNGNRALIGFVQLRDRTLQPTAWQEVVTRDDRVHTMTPYFLLSVGERDHILVLAKNADVGKHLIGPLSGARDLDLSVMAKVISKHPELKDHILPVVLNSEATFYTVGYVLLVFLAPWGAYCLWNTYRAMMARISPANHSLERQLARFGDANTLVASINQEVKQSSALRFGKAIVTESWVLRPTIFGAQCTRLEDVVWAYALHRNSENFSVMQLRTGRTVAIYLSRSQSTELIAALSDRAPWIILGYDTQRWKSWCKDRNAMIEESDLRRSKV